MYGADRRVDIQIWQGMQRSDMLGNMWADGVDPFASESWRYELANRALEDESLPDAKKLKNLIGDCFYNDRKKIVQRMIDHQHVDPNTIMCFDDKKPLYESVAFKDISFTKYLLEKGAIPDKKILKRMRSNPALMALLETEK
jgi:hypothetical protein